MPWDTERTPPPQPQTTTTNHHNSKQEEDVGQAELYAPKHAIKVVVEAAAEDQENKQSKEKGTMGVVGDIRRNLGNMKDKVLEKLAAAAVPSDALENSRHYLETVVRDVTVAAQGLTKDALHRIKTHLVDILPSLSPSVTRKMVDDAEKEASNDVNEGEEETEDGKSGKTPFLSPTSSLFASLRSPLSRL